MPFITRITTIISSITLLLATALLFASMILPSCFISDIFGFLLGLSFALYDTTSSVGVGGIMAIIAISINLFSTCLLCIGVAKSDDIGKSSNPRVDTAEMTTESRQPSTISVQYNTTVDEASSF
ncbi:hypothetical protein I4U23_015205 [Adineta vaga]|nr:hypothetical protein I4U23_015205 [Adineta vaga]